MLGQNFVLSEIHNAILLNGLRRLDEENEHRAANRCVLSDLLGAVPGVSVVGSSEGTDRASVYHLPIRIGREILALCDIEQLGEALSRELGCWIHQTYPPLNEHPLYCPTAYPTILSGEHLDPSRWDLPNAKAAHESHLLLHHSILLAGKSAMSDIAAAFDKVIRYVCQGKTLAAH